MSRFVSASQLAERYEVDRSTIWRWAANGILPPPQKISDQVTRWDLKDIEKRDAERSAVAVARVRTRGNAC